MDTQIIKIDSENIDKKAIEVAAKVLASGGLVAFPTETVYGLGANALDPLATKKIYSAKGRPSDNPLIIHVSRTSQVELYAEEVSPVAKKLMDLFWPGPLTLIFKRKPIISDSITGGLDTVAIRLPSHPIAREIIDAANLPIAAPSANRSGRPSPTRVEHVIEDLDGRVDIIVDGGSAAIGLESTVLDVTVDPPMILRPGYVTLEMLQDAIGKVDMDASIIQTQSNVIPKAPGMKYRHYAPQGSLTIVEGDEEKVAKYILEQVKMYRDKKVAIIATDEEAHLYEGNRVYTIGSKTNPEEVAANLFKILRLMDTEGIEYIFAPSFPQEHIGRAVMNRLLKAAGNRRVIL